MKKILILLVVLLVCLTGCGSSSHQATQDSRAQLPKKHSIIKQLPLSRISWKQGLRNGKSFIMRKYGYGLTILKAPVKKLKTGR